MKVEMHQDGGIGATVSIQTLISLTTRFLQCIGEESTARFLRPLTWGFHLSGLTVGWRRKVNALRRE